MSDLSLGMLFALLAAAGWTDWQSHRIPNWLVFGGAALGLAWNGLMPLERGWAASLEGLALGLVMLLPLYGLRAMSAGDVKLMAMVGSFLGPMGVFGAALATFLAGGAIAVAMALKNGVFGKMFRNLHFIVVGSAVKLASGSVPTADALGESAARMPYGIAIAAGTAAFVAWQRWQG